MIWRGCLYRHASHPTTSALHRHSHTRGLASRIQVYPGRAVGVYHRITFRRQRSLQFSRKLLEYNLAARKMAQMAGSRRSPSAENFRHSPNQTAMAQCSTPVIKIIKLIQFLAPSQFAGPDFRFL